jgi:ubiquinone/menaquinone biosynthesis C-methylase UbiE
MYNALPQSVLDRSLDHLKEHGLFGFLDSLAYVVIRKLRRSFYRWHRSEFELAEALYWGRYVDKWHRYNAVLTKIDEVTRSENQVISMLEVGCGSEGLAEFYPRLNHDSYTVDSLDVVLPHTSFRRDYPRPFNTPIVADACCLPFDDASKDFVISVDSLEHVPAKDRPIYISELVRVARRGVLLTCPMQSDGGDYAGGVCDVEYQRWYTKRFGRANETIGEHIEFGAPSVNQLIELFPGGEIHGVMNAQTWFKCMTFSGIPLLGQLTGLWFLIAGAANARRPPYYGGLLYLEKSK